MSTISEELNNEKKINLSSLGQFYQPITGNYCTIKSSLKSSFNSLSNKNQSQINVISESNHILRTKKTIKERISRSSRINESILKKTNNSYNLSRCENTTLSTIDNRSSLSIGDEEKVKINKIKELMVCFLCNKNLVLPRICPNCRKIACDECLKKWFIVENNSKCFFCNCDMDINKMIIIPIINNISNILYKNNNNGIINSSNIIFNSVKNIEIKDYNNKDSNKKNTIFENFTSRNNNNNSLKLKNFTINNPKDANTIYLYNLIKKLKKKKIKNSIAKIPYVHKPNKEFLIPLNCPSHPDQQLFYYCSDCEKSYCRTCFVFFGQEKNNHIGHKIIDYEKFKSINNNDLLNYNKTLKEKYEEINNIIKKCEDLKNCYSLEKKIVNKYIKFIVNKYNEKMELNITRINELINNYKKYIEQIKGVQNDIKKYKSNEEKNNFYEVNLFINVTKIKNLEYSKNIDIYSNLSPILLFNIYQSELKQFDIIDLNFHFRLKLNNSKYNFALLRKENEIQIYIFYPVEQILKKKLILPFVYMRKKDNNWELHELKEFLVYKEKNYFIKRFNVNNFCKENSFIKIKAVLYESSFI